jgi:predicted Zn-dependent protease
MRAGNARGALQQFAAALAANPENQDALAGTSQTHLNLGDLNRAEEAAQALLRVAPNNATGHRLRAEIMRRKRWSLAAARTAREAIALDPAEPLGYHILALCLAQEKRFREAFKVCEEGLALQPGSAILQAQRAVNVMELKGGKAAAAGMEAALHAAPDSPYVLRAAGRIALAQNNIERARDLLGMVLRRNANDRDALGLYLLTEPNRHGYLRSAFRFRYWIKDIAPWGILLQIGLGIVFLALVIPSVVVTNVPGVIVGLGVRFFLRSQYAAHSKAVQAHFASYGLNSEF